MVLGHKNPTNSVCTTAANVSPLPSQLNDTCKIVAINELHMLCHIHITIARMHSADTPFTSSKVKSPVKHTGTQGMYFTHICSYSNLVHMAVVLHASCSHQLYHTVDDLSGRCAESMSATTISLPEKVKISKGTQLCNVV